MTERLTTDGVSWDIVDIILVIALTYTLTPLLFWGGCWSLRCDFLQQNKLLILNLLRAGLLGVISLWVVKKKYGINLRQFGLRRIKVETGFRYGIIGGVGLCLLVLGINNLTHNLAANIFEIMPPTQQVIKDLLATETLVVFILHSLLIIVIAPVTEEIFFRGLVYPYLQKKMGAVKGIIVNGLVFGLAHFSLWVFIPTFLGGIVLGWIYRRTRSLYSAMLAHGVWNLIIVVLVYLVWHIN